ncbi:hypothetical protein K439DRAFT_1627115, partial [Ramaria rubella]
VSMDVLDSGMDGSAVKRSSWDRGRASGRTTTRAVTFPTEGWKLEVAEAGRARRKAAGRVGRDSWEGTPGLVNGLLAATYRFTEFMQARAAGSRGVRTPGGRALGKAGRGAEVAMLWSVQSAAGGPWALNTSGSAQTLPRRSTALGHASGWRGVHHASAEPGECMWVNGVNGVNEGGSEPGGESGLGAAGSLGGVLRGWGTHPRGSGGCFGGCSGNSGKTSVASLACPFTRCHRQEQSREQRRRTRRVRHGEWDTES